MTEEIDRQTDMTENIPILQILWEAAMRNWEYHLHWSGLGDGWAAAILNSVDELQFLWAINLQLNGLHEYTGVGGSTNSTVTNHDFYPYVPFSEYLPDDTGELCIHKYIVLVPAN